MKHPFSFSLALIGVAFSAHLSATPVTAQTLADGLDNPPTIGPITTLGFLPDGANLPAAEWTYTSGTTHDGTDAITSSPPPRGASQVNMQVQGPAMITYWWKMTGEPYFDEYTFSSRNDFRILRFDPVDPDWKQITTQVDTGVQPLRWNFQRRSNNLSFTPQAWLDQLVVTPIPNNPLLQAAVENTSYTLHSNDWTVGTIAGETVAKSANLSPNEVDMPIKKSTMVFEITGPATVRFKWGITAAVEDQSTLALFVENQTLSRVPAISGPNALSEVSLELGVGVHPMKFTFTRGENNDPDYTGETVGFVDKLEISPILASTPLADAIDRPGGVYSNAWIRQTAVSHDGSDAAMVQAPERDSARIIYVELPDEPGLLSFWYKMEADSFGYFYAFLDGQRIVQESGTKGWTRVEMNLERGTDRVLEAAFIRYTEPGIPDSSAHTRIFLDEVTFVPGATNYQPDLSIAPLKKGLIGIGVHNQSAVGQIATIRAPRTRPVGEFAIRIQNGSSTDTDTIKLRGSGSNRDFKIYYVVEEGGQKLNFSAAFAAGIFETMKLDPKATEAHEIWFARKKSKAKKRSHSYRIIGTSTLDPTKSDVVGTKIIVKNR